MFVGPGLTKCYGIILIQYEQRFGVSPSSAGLTLTTNILASLLGVVVGGGIFDRFRTNLPQLCLALVVSSSHIVLSFASSFTIVLIANIIIGFSNGINHVYVMGSLNTYFKNKRAFATAFAFSGGSMGHFVLQPLIQWVFDTYGYQGGMILLGGIWLHVLIIVTVLKPAPVSRSAQRSQVPSGAEGQEVQELEITDSHDRTQVDANIQQGKCSSMYCQLALIYLAIFFGSFAYYGYLIVFVQYGLEAGFSSMATSTLLSISAGVETVTRPPFGYIVTKYKLNKSYVVAACNIIAMICGLVATIFPSYALYAGYSVLFGMSGGFLVPMVMSMIPDVVTPSQLGMTVGGGAALISVGISVAAPVSGAVAELTGFFIHSLRIVLLSYIPCSLCLIILTVFKCCQCCK